MMLSFTRLLSTTLASVIISTSASRAAKILRDYQDYDVADSHVNSQTLIISDMVLSPDGFERPYVLRLFHQFPFYVVYIYTQVQQSLVVDIQGSSSRPGR